MKARRKILSDRRGDKMKEGRISGTFKAVILAGGSGERFWPLSTPERPKQFLRVFGGASLIRQAVSRLDGLVSPKDVFVVTAKNLVAATRRELPEIPKCNILGEPMRRDSRDSEVQHLGRADAPRYRRRGRAWCRPGSERR